MVATQTFSTSPRLPKERNVGLCLEVCCLVLAVVETPLAAQSNDSSLQHNGDRIRFNVQLFGLIHTAHKTKTHQPSKQGTTLPPHHATSTGNRLHVWQRARKVRGTAAVKKISKKTSPANGLNPFLLQMHGFVKHVFLCNNKNIPAMLPPARSAL